MHAWIKKHQNWCVVLNGYRHHLWQRRIVCLWPLVTTSGHDRCPVSSHHCVPPQWYCWVLPSSNEASLKAKLNTFNWLNELPLVLLGIQTALKEDIGCSVQRWCMVKHSGFLENSLFLLLMHPIHMLFSHTLRVIWPDCVQLQPNQASHLEQTILYSSQFDGVLISCAWTVTFSPWTVHTVVHTEFSSTTTNSSL